MICPHCQHELSSHEIAQLLGSIKSKKKSEASRKNGKLGGRPKGAKKKTKSPTE